MKTLIITTAVSYRPTDLWTFLASASRHCPAAAIIAIVHHRDLPHLAPCCERFPQLQLHPIHTPRRPLQHAPGFSKKLRRVLARLRSWLLARLAGLTGPLQLRDEAPSPFGLSSEQIFILNRRFFIARKLLRNLKQKPDAVLLSDSRDVVFQADPFASMQHGLHTGLEFHQLQDSPINAQWIRCTYGEQGMQRLSDLNVLCSGVTIGSTDAVLSYLNRFCDEIARHAVSMRSALIPIWDQAYHNMILRQDPPENLEFMPWDSDLATVGEVPTELLSINPDGSVRVNQTVPSILHQYDRHQAVTTTINNLYPSPQSLRA